MAYHGEGAPSHVYPGANGPGIHNSHYNINQGPHGPPPAGMYQQGHFNEYTGNNMHPAYGQQQGYYEPTHHGQMYDPGVGSTGHQNAGMGAPIVDSNHGMATPMMHSTNQPQMGRAEPTKILRNPYPTVSKEIKQKGNDVYDPSFPTGPSAGPGQFNQHRVAPPPPVISDSKAAQQAAPMYNNFSETQSTPAVHNAMSTTNVHMYGNSAYRNDVPQSQTPMGPAATSNYQAFSTAPLESRKNTQPEPSANGKMQIMTGVVTHVQPGSFGMVSEEIFFQENVVAGPLPRVGDKVVVEAEAVNGMPFKFNAKRVTRLDVDLVRDEKNVAPPTQVVQQHTQPQVHQYPNSQTSQQYNHSQPAQQYNHSQPAQQYNHSQPAQQYSHSQPAQQYNHSQPTQQYNHHQSNNRHPMHERESRFEPPNFGPLPSLPDSLNLPKAVPPPNLVSCLPSPSANLNQPLKSILKRKDRNPPPPPVISKNAGKVDVNPFRSSAPSSLKQSVFSVDLDRNIPTVLPPRGVRPPIEFPEYSFFNKEKPKEPLVQPAPVSPRVTRLLPRSPIPGFSGGNPNSHDNVRNQRGGRSRSRERGSPRRYKSRSRSRSPKSRSQRRSRSFSPRRSRRSRSRSVSPKTRRKISRSPSPRGRWRSRSASPGKSRRRSRSTSRSRRRSRSTSRSRLRSRSTSRGRRRSRSTSRSRRKSRSDSPRHRRRISRSVSRSPVIPRDRRNYRTRRSSKSRSTSRSPYRTGHSFDAHRSKSRSKSPRTISGAKVLEETVTHGIVVKRVCSDLFPRLTRDPDIQEVEVVCRDKNNLGPFGKPAVTPGPIKFQINNNAKPITPSSIVPNPTFKAANIVASTYLQNPAYNNHIVDAKLKKKKSKEQEPAFKVIDTPKPKSTAPLSASTNTAQTTKILRNPVNMLQLKQNSQNDLQQLRSQGSNEPGTKLLENPASIQNLKQKVQRDLEELKNKTTAESSSLSTSIGAKDKSVEPGTGVLNKNFDANVEQRLKDLRSKFENHIKTAKAGATGGPKKTTTTTLKPPVAPKTKVSEEPKVILVNDNLKDRNKPFHGKQPSEATSERSKGPPDWRNSESVELPPYDEKIESLQEEIHKQRFMEEENRLKSVGDQAGLHQLYYMEDRRRRRLEERHLARIRMTEIKFKQEKNFGELALLREEWGPPQLRLEQERELKQIRLNEEQQEKELHGQAEAIRKQEHEYQRWLEEEAMARSRNMPNSAKANRGCEGRVLRRRTPSPSNRRKPPSYTGGPPPEPRGPHPLRRGRSRSPSFERYKESWHRRHPRDRSPPITYEEFVMRYPIGQPPHSFPPEEFPPHHPGFQDHMPSRQLDQDGFFISRAMDDVARRQDELMHREMEIQHRMEMAQRRFAGPPSSHHDGRSGREEIRRYAVPRR